MINSTPENFEKYFPPETHDKKVFNFTKEELVTIRTYHAIKTLGEMAGLFIDNMLNGMLLPKQGIQPRSAVGTIYSAEEGTYTVYVPKNYCQLCKEQAGAQEFEGKKYCKNCLPLVKLKKEMDAKNVTVLPAETETNGESN